MKNFDYRGYSVEPKELVDYDIIANEQYGIGKKQTFNVFGKGKKFSVCLLVGEDELVKNNYIDSVEELLQGGIQDIVDVVDNKNIVFEENKYQYNFIFLQDEGWLRI